MIFVRRNKLMLLFCCLLVSLPKALFAGETIQLIRDRQFENGFWCLEPKHPLEGGRVFREAKLQLPGAQQDPVWELAQWYSRGTVTQNPPVKNEFEGLKWETEYKTFEINPAGCVDGELTLAIDSIAEFGGKLRNDEDPWPHLLIQQAFHHRSGPTLLDLPAISEIESAGFSVDLRLNQARHEAPASQFVLYFTIANVNRQSLGHGDMMWFGILFYDERSVAPEPFMIDGDRDHAKFIYNTGIAPFLPVGLKVGKWSQVKVELAPFLQDAFQQAWKRGYLTQSQDLSDYKITGMNLGWETPGLADVSMSVRDLSLQLKTK